MKLRMKPRDFNKFDRRKKICIRFSVYLLAILTVTVFVAYFTDSLLRESKLNSLLDMVEDSRAFRALEIPTKLQDSFREWETEGTATHYEYMAAYLVFGSENPADLDWAVENLRRYEEMAYRQKVTWLEAVWGDLKYFPVAYSRSRRTVDFTFADSWMQERKYGGQRGHEGTDVMPQNNERGIYPIVSMTDGVVEKIGWLPKGGYRIGIRAPHGAYFYYAHLFDYAREFQEGEEVSAGELLGYMGDSGYSEIPGTVGNFPVHLHLGIYVNDEAGNEVSLNPYWPLKALEDDIIYFDY